MAGGYVEKIAVTRPDPFISTEEGKPVKYIP